jgi:hypothetical protein
MSWEPEGNIKGPQGPPGDAVGATVASVFGRVGAVVAQAGDYDVTKITNAVSSLGAYKDPSWLQELSWAKITGTPTFGNVLSVFGRAGNVVASQDDYSFAQLKSKPTTLAGYGITDAVEVPLTFQGSLARVANVVSLVNDNPTMAVGSVQFYGVDTSGQRGFHNFPTVTIPVSSVFGRTGAVVAAQDDYTFAQLKGKPTTRAGYGITDAEAPLTFQLSLARVGDVVTLLGDVATPAASYYYGTNASAQRGWFALPSIGGGTGGVSSVFGRTGAVVQKQDDYSFASLSGKPTTLAGYGITDAYTKSEVTAAFAQISHTHTFASITSKPTTLAGYGITDAYTKGEVSASFAPIARAFPAGGATGQLIRKKTDNDFDTDWNLPANFQDVVKSNVTITGATAKNFGVGNVLTPRFSGKVLCILGTQLQTTGGAYATQCGIHYAPGALPANNTPATASPYAGNIYQTIANAPSDGVTFVALVTGLTIGTQYWFDLQGQNSNAAAVCTAILPVVTLIEIP